MSRKHSESKLCSTNIPRAYGNQVLWLAGNPFVHYNSECSWHGAGSSSTDNEDIPDHRYSFSSLHFYFFTSFFIKTATQTVLREDLSANIGLPNETSDDF